MPTPIDRDALAHHYATDDKLSVRYRTHERYTVPKIDFARWVLDCITWRGDEWVLDLGAGPGTYFEPVKKRIPRGRLFAGDLSLGMIQRQRENRASRGGGLINCDAQTIPFADAAFDVVLANHMLYGACSSRKGCWWRPPTA
jgi:SAM-dependent methyltransferase